MSYLVLHINTLLVPPAVADFESVGQMKRNINLCFLLQQGVPLQPVLGTKSLTAVW